MGNSCSTTVSLKSSNVISIRHANSPDELTFTDIDDAWAIIKRDNAKGKSVSKNLVFRRTGWKTIRVFVSSTFRDFNAERELLVKKVRNSNNLSFKAKFDI